MKLSEAFPNDPEFCKKVKDVAKMFNAQSVHLVDYNKELTNKHSPWYDDNHKQNT